MCDQPIQGVHLGGSPLWGTGFLRASEKKGGGENAAAASPPGSDPPGKKSEIDGLTPWKGAFKTDKKKRYGGSRLEKRFGTWSGEAGVDSERTAGKRDPSSVWGMRKNLGPLQTWGGDRLLKSWSTNTRKSKGDSSIREKRG